MSERVYLGLVQELSGLLEEARRSSTRAVNFVMTATYWEMGRRIVEFEQSGSERAAYGTELLARLARDLAKRFGRGFSRPNLQRFREFYLHFPETRICSTLSSKLGESAAGQRFPLPWSHYVLLLSRSRSPEALAFYHSEALRGGWSVRQLERQLSSRFYERTALSKNKAAMLTRGAEPRVGDVVSVDDQVRDPLVLEFLDLKDEYSESDLEEALVLLSSTASIARRDRPQDRRTHTGRRGANERLPQLRARALGAAR